MGDSETNDYESSSLCFSSLLCQEDGSHLNEREEREEATMSKNYYCFVSEEEDEYIENMFKRESFFFGFGSQTNPTTHTCFESARSIALDWIFNTRVKLGFNFRTLYLSITYFDRFLSKRHIDSGKIWAIRLLSVACLSLAAKIEECHVPMLSEFPVGDFEFQSKLIQRMELLVLTELEWKMGSLTPFSYLNYFVNKFENDQSSKGLIISRAVELILAMTKETKSNDHRPSIVAACAVLVSSDSQLTSKTIEPKTNVIKFWRSQDMEDVYSCCEVLKDIERKRKVKTPELESHYRIDDTTLNPASTTKRRLNFKESDHNNPAAKIRRA